MHVETQQTHPWVSLQLLLTANFIGYLPYIMGMIREDKGQAASSLLFLLSF